MSEFNPEDNPHGVYREEDDSKVDDILGSEIEQADEQVPVTMGTFQQQLAAMQEQLDRKLESINVKCTSQIHEINVTFSSQLAMMGSAIDSIPRLIREEFRSAKRSEPV
jgi:hypothetical protein